MDQSGKDGHPMVERVQMHSGALYIHGQHILARL
jgi:hypothetical protein